MMERAPQGRWVDAAEGQEPLVDALLTLSSKGQPVIPAL